MKLNQKLPKREFMTTDNVTSSATAFSQPGLWTCPFCPLLCDNLGVPDAQSGTGTLTLTGSDCPRAKASLALFGATADASAALAAGLVPHIQGQPCELDQAIEAAAALLVGSQQALFGGWGTDVAGARSLYRLAAQTGAIYDAAGGESQMKGLRALQDRGAFTTSLAELRTRADVLVCFGSWPTQRYPEFFKRCGLAEDVPGHRHVVMVGVQPQDDPDAWAYLTQHSHITVECLPWQGDVFDSIQLLAALVAGRAVDAAPQAWKALAERLAAARYAVIVHEAARLPVHGALVVEGIAHVVGQLNLRTRAAALPLGGDDGALSAQQVVTWMSGLPMRSRAGPAGLEHEPLRFGTQRLLADHAVDALLWVASFGADAKLPETDVPSIVLSHPVHASAAAQVFIPVATPGMNSDGHLFRTDSVVLMPVHALPIPSPDLPKGPLPSVSQVLDRLSVAVHAIRANTAGAQT